MTALDFPASPAMGQLYVAPNGVTYQWNGVLWLSVQTSPLQKNSFMATIASAAIPAAPSVFIFNSFIYGDASSGYSTTTGRFTPPAGVYWLYAAGYGIYAGSSTALNMTLRKNGVPVAVDVNTTYAAGGTNDVSVGALVESNGSDFFDVLVSANNTATMTNAYFTALPLSGMKGPTGDQGPPGGGLSAAFHAYASGVSVPVSAGVMPLATPTFNKGGYLVGSRFTPPAGIYALQAGMGVQGGASTNAYAYIYKNGVIIGGGATGYTGNGGIVLVPVISMTVEANGTDYFEAYWQSNGAGAVLGNPWAFFSGAKLDGTKGLPGDPGGAGFNAFSAIATVSQTLPAAGTQTKAIFQTAALNDGGAFSLATNRFVPPAGKRALITVQGGVQPVANGYSVTTLYKNGVAYKANISFNASGTQRGFYGSFSIPVLGNGTDYYELYMYTTNADSGTDASSMIFGAVW